MESRRRTTWKNVLKPAYIYNFFSKIAPFIRQTHTVDLEGPQMKRYGSSALHAGCLWIQTIRVRNTYCFFTASMVAPKLFDVTLYVNCLSCYEVNVKVLSGFVIENKSISTSTCHYFEIIRTLCYAFHLSFVFKA
jgi:hypothetical protein